MAKVVIDRLDRLKRNLLWKGQHNKKKLHPVRWSEVVKPKWAEGLVRWNEVVKPKWAEGLGLGDLGLKNWAILAKWWWRFGEERDAFRHPHHTQQELGSFS
eukprot:TRINITY_DN7882_c0_g1_i1.p1 TRINITY_DN7882_c0_g1~~TRINITY_DN7882_c0_g1_i1.p1  ORF type:complete len:101 (-),score=19.66 TRINITY_DN7882_c0_g1_i1:1-303(-)